MALTRKQLREMGLEDDIIESIIRAHGETVDALKQERDAARQTALKQESAARERDALAEEIARLNAEKQEPERIQAEFDAYRQTVESEKTHAQARQALRKALLDAGANDKAVDLLILGVPQDSLVLQEGSLQNAEELVSSLRGTYDAFFARPVRAGTPVLNPPASQQPRLDREAISRMSPEEINRNWSAVSSALSKGA